MAEQKYYSIGEVSRICGISKKTLRYYDAIGLVSPDRVLDNNYRYYSRERMQLIPMIRYYKQMGFKLEEMRRLLSEERGGPALEASFREKLAELSEEARRIERQQSALKAWYDLLQEAKAVRAGSGCEVRVRYVERRRYLTMGAPFDGNYRETLINIDFANLTRRLERETIGPLLLRFPSLTGHLRGESRTVELLQQTVADTPSEHTAFFGGAMYLSCYHVGAQETAHETYRRMLDWAAAHRYRWADWCCERCVADDWTTRERRDFVTELLIPVEPAAPETTV